MLCGMRALTNRKIMLAKRLEAKTVTSVHSHDWY